MLVEKDTIQGVLRDASIVSFILDHSSAGLLLVFRCSLENYFDKTFQLNGLELGNF